MIRIYLLKSASRAAGLPVTKRSILKVVAGMYDTLRIISPVVVSIKVLFQELCEGWMVFDSFYQPHPC